MDQERIDELYRMFNIPEFRIPKYSNPNEFASGFTKCSILREVFSVSSGSTEDFILKPKDKKL